MKILPVLASESLTCFRWWDLGGLRRSRTVWLDAVFGDCGQSVGCSSSSTLKVWRTGGQKLFLHFLTFHLCIIKQHEEQDNERQINCTVGNTDKLTNASMLIFVFLCIQLEFVALVACPAPWHNSAHTVVLLALLLSLPPRVSQPASYRQARDNDVYIWSMRPFFHKRVLGRQPTLHHSEPGQVFFALFLLFSLKCVWLTREQEDQCQSNGCQHQEGCSRDHQRSPATTWGPQTHHTHAKQTQA